MIVSVRLSILAVIPNHTEPPLMDNLTEAILTSSHNNIGALSSISKQNTRKL